MQNLDILLNPYDDPELSAAIFDILNSYALDPMGGSEALGGFTRENLLRELQRRDWVMTFLALLNAEPVGILIAMEGFSTFAAKPLINIHDVAVMPHCRGKGVGKALFAAVEAEAVKRDCCKLTLEVLSGNEKAIQLYRNLGFLPYVLDPEIGKAEFWEKKLMA